METKKNMGGWRCLLGYACMSIPLLASIAQDASLSYSRVMGEGDLRLNYEMGTTLMKNYDKSAWEEVHEQVALIHQVAQKLANESQDLDPAFVSAVDEAFWELLA